MCAWINEIRKILSIGEKEKAELQRFFKRFEISRAVLLDKEVSLNEVYWYAGICDLYAVIGNYRYKMHVHPIPN